MFGKLDEILFYVYVDFFRLYITFHTNFVSTFSTIHKAFQDKQLDTVCILFFASLACHPETFLTFHVVNQNKCFQQGDSDDTKALSISTPLGTNRLSSYIAVKASSTNTKQLLTLSCVGVSWIFNFSHFFFKINSKTYEEVFHFSVIVSLLEREMFIDRIPITTFI